MKSQTEHDRNHTVSPSETLPHEADGTEIPKRGHNGRDSHGGHGGHADHAEMFRTKFWMTLVLSVPVVYFSD